MAWHYGHRLIGQFGSDRILVPYVEGRYVPSPPHLGKSSQIAKEARGARITFPGRRSSRLEPHIIVRAARATQRKQKQLASEPYIPTATICIGATVRFFKLTAREVTR